MTFPNVYPHLTPFAAELSKLAEQAVQAGDKKEPRHPATIMARNLLAFGGGLGAGVGAGYLIDKGYTAATGKDTSKARFVMPGLVAAGYLGNHLYNRWKDSELKEMQDAHKARRDRPKGGDSGQ